MSLNSEILKKYLRFTPEVKNALDEGKPLVALESTIIAHGMPYPQNVETALRVEAVVRQTGAVPATLGIIGGVMVAGMTVDDLDQMGKNGRKVAKVSRRDVPFVMASGGDGATTVAATMMIAELAGIKVFATGGIGGVHRGATQTMDISADLPELANTKVAVVSAGAKSILDLPLTLEYLETHGVPVLGYRTTEFPAFYTRKSGLGVDYTFNEVSDMAKAIHLKWLLGLKGGVLIANPIPEAFEMDFAHIEAAIQKALKNCSERGITGKAISPFLLENIQKLTDGESLSANIELVLHNAKLAGELAVALSRCI